MINHQLVKQFITMDNSLLKKYRNNNGRIVGKRILTIDVPSLATPRVSCTEKIVGSTQKKIQRELAPLSSTIFFILTFL
jgi:hypothetical protein